MSSIPSTSKEEEKEENSKNKEGLASKIDALTSFLSEKFSLEEQKHVLESPTIDEVVKFIQSGKCKNIVTMVGAGISTSAGIPDFRTPGSGLYDNLQKYDLPHPEAIFTLDYFFMNSKPFFMLAKELYPGTFKPSKSHYFIKLLEEKGLLLRHYTQNIDTLERVAGVSNDKLVEAHGTFHTGHCLGCRKEYSQDWMKVRIFNDETPICEDCPGVVKPDIVFFGENLPLRFFKLAKSDFKKCDLLIIMGSSLTVQPFGSLPERVASSCPRVLINNEKAGNLEFDNPNNYRDILMEGDCDLQCQVLADKLGWSDELKELIIREHKLIDDNIQKTDASAKK
ncbi:PREDICTED: NAD-dependent protein deacetylase sirtuin-2 [Nicrophorus vespilloides]|uniref:NAD-dependent protein deacetylase n=1 Tax=Nicrophorus vespilloides TaxID=110193 RepID=A0ABM1MGA3_NICVS|nr:PREDICTED: NAD-dependent protein deacetylase sirtuin-2 [Nicrophorus vespilloides]